MFYTRLASGFNTVGRRFGALSNLVQARNPAIIYKSQTHAEKIISSSSKLGRNSRELGDQQTAARTRNLKDELQQQIYRQTLTQNANLKQKKLVNKSLVYIALCPGHPQVDNKQRSMGQTEPEPQSRHLTDQILTWPWRLFRYAGATFGRTCTRMSAFSHQTRETIVAAFQTTRTRTAGFLNTTQTRFRNCLLEAGEELRINLLMIVEDCKYIIRRIFHLGSESGLAITYCVWLIYVNTEERFQRIGTRTLLFLNQVKARTDAAFNRTQTRIRNYLRTTRERQTNEATSENHETMDADPASIPERHCGSTVIHTDSTASN
ncbi:uncharacterized protein LOC124864752 [Girardinichthys multiradiatus]|uniref:uncharacterized protein LOC124864752 n=1 Tax=Girardinichthys multiradiatus TaxID=208333 RepID=UPI001FACDEE0|nr:uncharacterized protein LOC124864752 [Girardinichthys multiradiatus]